VRYQPLRGDLGHHTIGMVDPAPAVVAERERKGLHEFIGGGGPEQIGVVLYGRRVA
jgi:hypothetical protein